MLRAEGVAFNGKAGAAQHPAVLEIFSVKFHGLPPVLKFAVIFFEMFGVAYCHYFSTAKWFALKHQP